MSRQRKAICRVWIRLPLEAHRIMREQYCRANGWPYTELDPPPPSGFVEVRLEFEHWIYELMRAERNERRMTISEILTERILEASR